MTYEAPWSQSLRIGTPLVCVILAAEIVVMLVLPQLPNWVRWVVISSTILLLAICSLFAVRRFTITPDAIEVRRLFWTTSINLSGLRGVAVDPEAGRGAVRVMGMGGFLCHCGYYMSKRLGEMRVYATDFKRSVVLEFADQKVVVTPDDPEEFARVLRVRKGLA